MGIYLKQDDLEYYIEAREVESTNEMNIKIGTRYVGDSQQPGTVIDQTLTKADLRRFLTEIEKIYYYF